MTNDSVGSVECSKQTAQARKNLAMMHKFSEYFAIIAVKQFSPLVSCQCVSVYVYICVCTAHKSQNKNHLLATGTGNGNELCVGDVCANFIGIAQMLTSSELLRFLVLPQTSSPLLSVLSPLTALWLVFLALVSVTLMWPAAAIAEGVEVKILLINL